MPLLPLTHQGMLLLKTQAPTLIFYNKPNALSPFPSPSLLTLLLLPKFLSPLLSSSKTPHRHLGCSQQFLTLLIILTLFSLRLLSKLAPPKSAPPVSNLLLPYLIFLTTLTSLQPNSPTRSFTQLQLNAPSPKPHLSQLTRSTIFLASTPSPCQPPNLLLSRPSNLKLPNFALLHFNLPL